MSTSAWDEFVGKIRKSHETRDYPPELMNLLKGKRITIRDAGLKLQKTYLCQDWSNFEEDGLPSGPTILQWWYLKDQKEENSNEEPQDMFLYVGDFLYYSRHGLLTMEWNCKPTKPAKPSWRS